MMRLRASGRPQYFGITNLFQPLEHNLHATFRNDVSSTLSPKNRSYFYPSVSGSLIFSNLFEHKEWFTFGKLRASWAKVGGDTSPYQLQLEYGNSKPYTNKGILG